ncbi:hypothetical protein [Amycolatopsis sp. H20-H5]|uniref:hypothetical protein n=1 Tax=Amycolatopsis sp. H20-H5 TaxID=3046309 RepID=UPI002DB6CEFD|nr:hypothetical protein [Amycolatopsis sp. H20-H5]MEC3977176.1 hypothetical protein [Amycolatopsis sp. H20-H5]
MAKRDMIDDVVDVVHPMPGRRGDDGGEAANTGRQDVEVQRRVFEESMRVAEEKADGCYDPLLSEIGRARVQMREAEQRLRLLVAYGREFVSPRPYQLKDLAAAAGYSVSGTRSAYFGDEISEVAARVGRPSRSRRSLASISDSARA